MENKTKAALVEEIHSLKEQLEETLKKEKFDAPASDLHNMYESLVRSGFSEEQAYELLKLSIISASKK